MTMSVVRSVNTVGSKNVPPSAERLPPVTTLAPFLTASAMCASTFFGGLHVVPIDMDHTLVQIYARYTEAAQRCGLR